MTTTTDSTRLRYIGGLLAKGGARIVGREQMAAADRWVIRIDGEALHQCVDTSLRPSWVRYANRGKPAGRRKAQEASIQMGLTLPVSVLNRIPSPRQSWIRQVIGDRLMVDQATEYLTGGA